jgi:glycosyltransferase involved in cell wall biosynthesis
MVIKKRLVFVAEYLGAEVNSTSYYWTKILESISSDFDVLVISPNSKENVKYLESSSFCYELYPHVLFSKSNMISRLFSYVKMAVGFFRLSKNKLTEHDVVISGTNSIFNLFFIAYFKHKHSISWVLFGYDVFPDNLVPANVINKWNPFYKLASLVFSWLYNQPDDIVAVGRDMRSLFSSKLSDSSKIHYIPNWADHTKVQLFNKSDSKVLKELNLIGSEYVVFQFFGNLGVLQDVYGIINAIKHAQATNARFVFIGSGSEANNISSLIKGLNDDRIYFYGRCDMVDKDHALSACDVAFVSLKEGMYGLAVPSKSYFSLAANKPILVIADDGSELRQLVEDYPIGWGCSSNDPIMLASIIDGICLDYKQVLDLRPREVLINNFSEDSSLNSIKQLIIKHM